MMTDTLQPVGKFLPATLTCVSTPNPTMLKFVISAIESLFQMISCLIIWKRHIQESTGCTWGGVDQGWTSSSMRCPEMVQWNAEEGKEKEKEVQGWWWWWWWWWHISPITGIQWWQPSWPQVQAHQKGAQGSWWGRELISKGSGKMLSGCTYVNTLVSLHTFGFFLFLWNTQEIYFISQSIVFDHLLMTFTSANCIC